MRLWWEWGWDVGVCVGGGGWKRVGMVWEKLLFKEQSPWRKFWLCQTKPELISKMVVPILIQTKPRG